MSPDPSAPKPRTGGAAVTIGSFDGVHRGHRRLVEAARRLVAAGGACVAVTFEPHPRCVVDPKGCPPLLSAAPERVALLREAGADTVVVLPFTRELSRWSAARFCDELVRTLSLRHLVAGPGFALGHGREGDDTFLRRYGAEHGFAVHTVRPVTLGGAPVSSGRIRTELQAGRVGAAAAMLGRPYVLGGTVVRGEGRGTGLGVPTANLAVDPQRCLPAEGVYATLAAVAAGDGRPAAEYAAATSIGRRPTFDGHGVTVEAHLLDFAADLYGRPLELRFLRRVRGERRFPDAGRLVARMGHDIEIVRRVLEGRS